MFHRECPWYEEGAQSCPHYQLTPVNAIHTLSGIFKATVAFLPPLTCGFKGCKKGDIGQGRWVSGELGEEETPASCVSAS